MNGKMDIAFNVLTFLKATRNINPAARINPITFFHESGPSVILFPEKNCIVLNTKDPHPKLVDCPNGQIKPFCVVIKDFQKLSPQFMETCVNLQKSDDRKQAKPVLFAYVFEPNSKYFSLFQVDSEFNEKCGEKDHAVLGSAFKTLQEKRMFVNVPPAGLMVRGTIKINSKRQVCGLTASVFKQREDIELDREEQLISLSRTMLYSFGMALDAMNCPRDTKIMDWLCTIQPLSNILKKSNIATLGDLLDVFRPKFG